ncbi:MAG: glycosyltransferase family 39 protein [Pseudomonadota bacterium]|nr:glycosyltransferase family 39 protein [Pseudomonadota bacterium]
MPGARSSEPVDRLRFLDPLGALLAGIAGIVTWAAARGPDSALRPATSPAWARFRDHLLEGPDAGAWASNASALWLGRTEDLDPHRLPILPRLTALVLEILPDPALAGHLVNHLVHVALGPVVYLLGRRWMGRGMALAAAIAAVGYTPSVLAADRYGVDPLVTLALPAALLAAECAARHWKLAPLFGVVVGFASSAHLTTIGIGVPALLLALLRGEPGFRRWLGAGGLAAGALLGVGLAFLNYPILEWGLLTGSLAEGVAPAGPNGDAANLVDSMARAIATVRTGGPAALEHSVAFLAAATRPAWLPWSAALWLPWLGIAGFGLSAAPPLRPGGFSRVIRERLGPFRGLGAGVPLALALVPVLVFAAAGSPPRYTQNYHPLGVLLVFRGADVVLRLAERALEGAFEWAARGSFGHRWVLATRGGLGLLVGAATVVGLWPSAHAFAGLGLPPSQLDVADWRLGQVVASHFPPGGGASCLRREVVAYAARTFCPHSPGFDFADAAEPTRSHLDSECPGEGPIPYVVLSGIEDGSTATRRRIDAWVIAHGTLVQTVTNQHYQAAVYSVERVTPP